MIRSVLGRHTGEGRYPESLKFLDSGSRQLARNEDRMGYELLGHHTNFLQII
jgi:hypothetical protein